jgi:tRNA (guanine-N7-)-methyltransferase
MRKKPNLGARLEAAGSVFAATPEEQRGRWRAAFGDYAEAHIEIGCGKGKFTAETAAANPDALLVAIERVPEAAVVAAERVIAAGIPNVRFIRGDANRLREYFAEAEIPRIYINFPDPWHKARHEKRRLTSPGYLAMYRDILAPGGEIRFRTDNVPLFGYSLETFPACGFALSGVTRDLHADGAATAATDYETKFIASGVKICSLTAVKE